MRKYTPGRFCPKENIPLPWFLLPSLPSKSGILDHQYKTPGGRETMGLSKMWHLRADKRHTRERKGVFGMLIARQKTIASDIRRPNPDL